MKTRSAKAKGRRCAVEVQRLLVSHSKHLTFDDVVVTSSGETGEDIKLSPMARDEYPLTIECKNVERLNVWQALEQAEKRAGEDRQPALFFRRNRSRLYVAVRAETLIKALQRIDEN